MSKIPRYCIDSIFDAPDLERLESILISELGRCEAEAEEKHYQAHAQGVDKLLNMITHVREVTYL